MAVRYDPVIGRYVGHGGEPAGVTLSEHEVKILTGPDTPERRELRELIIADIAERGLNEEDFIVALVKEAGWDIRQPIREAMDRAAAEEAAAKAAPLPNRDTHPPRTRIELPRYRA